MTDTATVHTAEKLSKLEFRGPVRFLDGRGGMAQQDFECTTEPRFGYAWRRESRKDRGRQFYTVDGREVADFEEAARLLNQPADPDSPRELERREHDDFLASPRLAGMATRALGEAQCNAAAGPMGPVRAWRERVDHPWHVGINRYSEEEREAGRGHPHWPYLLKTASWEFFRLQYLWRAYREQDTGLTCALGIRCRDCSILKHIEQAMVEARANERFPRQIEEEDIDATKTWTCIGHILQELAGKFIDGGFLSTKSDRDHPFEF